MIILEMPIDVREKLWDICEENGVPPKKMSYNKRDKLLRVYFKQELTEQQKTLLRKVFSKLVKEAKVDKLDEYEDKIAYLTPSKADTYIDNHVTDLASAKKFLKKLTRTVLYLYREKIN